MPDSKKNKHPINWISVELNNIRLDLGKSITPNNNPDENFELYSVPACESGFPEYLKGKEINSTKKEVFNGSVLLCKINPRINRVWIVGKSDHECKIASTEWIVFNELKNLNSKYLLYFLTNQSFREYLMGNISGVGGSLTRISPTTALKYNIPLPPLAEQHRIVEKLEEEFTRLDAGVSALKRAKALIPKYRQSVLKSAMCGDLTKEWQKKEYGNCKNEWKWQLIKDIAVVSGGLTKNQKRLQYSLKCPYLRVANVYSNNLELNEVLEIGINEAEINRYSLQKGDLLIVEGNGSIGQIGRVALWDGSIDPCLHQNHLIKARFNKNCNKKFALYWMMSPVGRDKIISASSSTSGLNTLNITKISNLPIPTPPLEEQHEIVLEIERRFSIIDEMERVVLESLLKAERLRQSVLKCAFEGRLVPQNPDDEPASVLLERILGEKKASGKKEKRINN